MAEQKLKTASVLAFERKLSNSDGFMYAGNWSDLTKNENWKPISIKQKDVRGVTSNRLPNAVTSDEAKLNADIQKANLQTVDTAALPETADTLKLSFTLRVLGDLATPSVCNKPEYQTRLEEVINTYVQENKFDELSKRYAENIANGRFLWRNRIGAEEVQINVRHIVNQKINQQWKFNAHDFDLRSFASNSSDVSELSKVIQDGLLGESFALLEVDAFVRLGKAQEIFPSQDLVLDTAGESKKSKQLYKVNDVAAMHSQKIGNALRTIDTWYPDENGLGPIAIEPYGSVTSRGKAYRQPKQKTDFYSLLDAWVLKDQAPDIEQQHYVMAILIRGGVFGEAS